VVFRSGRRRAGQAVNPEGKAMRTENGVQASRPTIAGSVAAPRCVVLAAAVLMLAACTDLYAGGSGAALTGAGSPYQADAASLDGNGDGGG
jgi:hypothetical protein